VQVGGDRGEQLVAVARPGDQQAQPGPAPGERDEGGAQHVEALARLGEAAEEAERPALARPAGNGSAVSNLAIVTPFGISTAPPPRCSTCTLRASSLTAIRAVIFSTTSWSRPAPAERTRERVIAVWKVATTGPRAESTASSDRLSVIGSWTCSTSKLPRDSQRRTRAVETGPKAIRATEPLYGSGSARPAGTTYGGRSASSSAGARTLTSWPSRSARWRGP